MSDCLVTLVFYLKCKKYKNTKIQKYKNTKIQKNEFFVEMSFSYHPVISYT